MSLRVRLLLLILALVTLSILALSAVHLETLINSLSADAVARAEYAGNQVSSFVQEHIRRHLLEYPPQDNLEQTKNVWSDIVVTDPDITLFLEGTMAQSRAILAINVGSDNGLVLVSSTPENTGRPLRHQTLASEWSKLPWHQRLYDLLQRRPNLESNAAPLGIAGLEEPVFTFQVLTSTVLMRQQVIPYLERVAQVTGVALLLTVVITMAFTHRMLRPVQRIEATIDRISQGQYQGGAGEGPLAKEFQAVESKLLLLGQQFRDARESSGIIRPANIGEAVERIASELDVATRLAAISRLSSGVAHEIKNPLNAILLRLEFLRARLGEGDPDLGQELDILSREVLRLDRVVKTFLDFSRPVEVRFQKLDLGAVAREVAELVRPQAALASIEVECCVPAEPAWMSGDPDLLKQALLNLVTNAVEAMTPTGGRLRVSLAGQERDLVLEVADTGPGIPADLRAKVFQLYFTTKSQGSGIGLAMTYRAVQLHNGIISFSSEAGQGTTFRMAFPAAVQHG
jgi:signal transduction histidine kinase